MDGTANLQICGESKFRELEDEFLQKRARMWLSEVLKRKLDEEQNISDMLADGDLLFDASIVLWKMLLEKEAEVKDVRVFSRTKKCKKLSGKYMPYSNVDAFLKICQLMGVTGVDLFSPSDVVERRDTRKVCMCIRSLSKKARSIEINVPDFDIVTCTGTITTPTNLIGYTRRSLELLSQCGSMSPESYNSCNVSDPLTMMKKSVASRASSYDLYSEESDDADSSVSVGYYRLSTKLYCNAALIRKSDSLSSIESFSLSKQNNLEEALAHFGVYEGDMDKHDYLSPPSVNSIGSVAMVDTSELSSISSQMKLIDSDSRFSSPMHSPGFNPMPNLLHHRGKVCDDFCDVMREFDVYSDGMEQNMKSEGKDTSVSCLDFQSYASDSQNAGTTEYNIRRSSKVTSDCGESEAELLYELKDWSVDHEDLENVHLSIIESFLSTTSCPKSEPSTCNEKSDESYCWNLDADSNDTDVKPVLPISSCDQFLQFLDEFSYDDKLLEDLSFMGAIEDKGVIRFPNDAHQAKLSTHGTDSPCEREACDKVLLQCCTKDGELDATMSDLSHTPMNSFYDIQHGEECLEANLIDAEVLVRRDLGTAKLNQPEKSKSPVMKSIMGGAALLGVLAFFLSSRICKNNNMKERDSPQPSHLPVEEKKLTSHTANTRVMKKGVYASGKFKFS